MHNKGSFPEGFVWGVSTSAYQIEGAVDEDGRGKSIWDAFCETEGNIKNGDTGAIACDHYHRYEEDVALMADLGIKAYRLSIGWPRILPKGLGAINKAGLDFYDRLVDELLGAGIEPYVTLYHWDLPQALQEGGGWSNRDSINWFKEYVRIVVERLGDRVKYWITHNEPWVVAYVGHAEGRHAPGIKDFSVANQVAHNLLVSHGEAVSTIRETGGKSAKVGISLNLSPAYPASDLEKDQAAARRYDGWINRWFLDAIFQGHYPEDMLRIYNRKGVAPDIYTRDLEIINMDIDFVGLNYYSRTVVKADFETQHPLNLDILTPNAGDVTATGWEIYPEGLYELLLRLHQDYEVPSIYITENGAATSNERPEESGLVRDTTRISYLRRHLKQAHRAIEEGVPLGGYFVWSLMDNFEWEEGYCKAFGLIHVDYETQARLPKESAKWYKGVIEANRL